MRLAGEAKKGGIWVDEVRDGVGADRLQMWTVRVESLR